MNDISFSILLVLIGLFVGVISMLIINYIRGNLLSKKAELMLEKAKKEADKIKRDYLLDAKEEAHKIKAETDQEVKDKKIGLIYSYCAVVDENGARMDGYHRNAEGIPLYAFLPGSNVAVVLP